MTIKLKYLSRLLLIFILLLSIFFRFYKLHDWLVFGMDQENEALIIQNIVQGKHFPLLGLSVGDTGLYRGPLFLYLFSIPTLLFSGNPLIGAMIASFLGVVTTFFIYKVGKSMMTEQIGLWSALFYAGSFLVSFYDRQFWNPSVIPLLSLMIGYICFRILNKEFRLFPFLALLFGIAIHSHFSILIFLPFIIYIIIIKRKSLTKKLIIISFMLFIITQLPLIFFDLRHNFQLTQSFLHLFQGKNTQEIYSMPLLDRSNLLISTTGRFFALPTASDLFTVSGQCRELLPFKRNPYPEVLLIAISGFTIFSIRCFKKGQLHIPRIVLHRFKSAKIIFVWIFLSATVFTVLYTRTLFEYYFIFLLPWLALVFGLSTDFIWHKKHGALLVTPIVFLFLILNISTLFNASYSYGYKDKKRAIEFVKQRLHTRNYTLEALGECPRFGGYRYLFEYYIGPPIHSYMDSYFAFLYPDKILDKKSEKIILLSMIDKRMSTELIKKWQEEKLRYLLKYNVDDHDQFGKIQVYILSNRQY